MNNQHQNMRKENKPTSSSTKNTGGEGEVLVGGGKKKQVKKETGLGLTNKKDDNFGEWSWTMVIWKIIQRFFEAELEMMDVEDCYFPLFVSENALKREQDHIKGFTPEVAWVTKSVRWEFSHPTPFIRSREFLWQEGHTAFATKEEADKEVLEILELYRRIYEEFLAIPVVKGQKSELEKFAGGLYTMSVEAFIPNTGRGIQGATSHCLGQKFAKMFDISFENKKELKKGNWSGRTLGGTVPERDDKGLVPPPKVASVQVVVVPVTYKDADMQGIFEACMNTVKTLREKLVSVLRRI
ncbi:Proline--trna ligase [Thalictrum thalictroides]|uniref:Proline--trna ligase n=1 Tax=Thalictrum thalictroides TaxID=46969 RepID=A0A7J6WIH5_THATH|nr:Proline--trna ligase [Thalictrum thalictroides]